VPALPYSAECEKQKMQMSPEASDGEKIKKGQILD
jgi:hypothetical protein